jgi:bleomycin hydrolase
MSALFRLDVKKLINIIMIILPVIASAQLPDTTKEENKKSPYIFTMEKKLPNTSIKAQFRTGTCWCFATIAFLESEMLRTGKEEIDLSEMYIVRYTYPRKAANYVRLHGASRFDQGGHPHDVIETIKEYGMVPEEIYDGLRIEEKKHNHGEMYAVLRAMVDAIIKNSGKKVTPRWPEAFEKVCDIYLGELPSAIEYKNKAYTAKTFAAETIGLNIEDYIEITSYIHHPYYGQFQLEIPDNWNYNRDYYNVPLDDFERIIDHSIQNGYTVVYSGDFSENSLKKGVGTIPLVDWEDMTKKEQEAETSEPVIEKEVDQKMRQAAFNNYTTTDDHSMHIVGIARDQNNTKFYYLKNSHGTDKEYNGFIYLSRAYVRLKTTALMINKNALPSDLKEKLNID